MPRKKTTPTGDSPGENAGPEYHCSVFFYYNKLKKKQEYCIRIETTKQFSTLSYRLTVDAEKKKQKVILKIKGLTPDHTYLSLVKPAISDSFFEELYGDYDILVQKQDGTINRARFNFNVFKKEILLLKAAEEVADNVSMFCTFQTAEDLNTFE